MWHNPDISFDAKRYDRPVSRPDSVYLFRLIG